MPIYSILGIRRIFLKNKKVILNQFLIPVIDTFQKNLIKRLREKFKSVYFGSQNDPYPPFGA